MLRFLGVRHLAVIDQLDIEFEPGLNILTGETGAGKSIIVGAIDLLVGGRASGDLVRTGEETASVQAVFEHGDGRETIVRREISAQGRSRAFIGDALATVAALRDAGQGLVDLHGQHEHQALLDPAEHLSHLDAFLGDDAPLRETGAAFEVWRAAWTALDRSRLDDREKRARIEMAAFQLDEIDRVGPAVGEDDRLDLERGVLANADRLARLSNEAFAALYDGEHAALASLALVWKRVADLAVLDPRFLPYVADRDAVKSGLEDLAMFLRSYAADLEASPDRLQAVEDRLAVLERLKRKYGPTLGDVLSRRHALADELAALGAGEERAAALSSAERDARTAFLDRARTLSAIRRDGAGRLARALEIELAELAMPKSRVVVDMGALDRPESWTPKGVDTVEFFLSSNPGEEPRPLARIASGGELSRIMLALRTVADRGDAGRTLVFDEVDAGIGGAAADAVGARLVALSRRHQVLCITHLPQIAARPAAHFLISKEVRGGRTSTQLRRLDAPAREQEIARMIAGAVVSPQVLASARELLAIRESEATAKAKGRDDTNRAKAKGRSRGA
jgi:DNA repair protein RecN (Recombination protein N)